MLGAVRRPDRIFDTYTTIKKTNKGVSQIEDTKAAAMANIHQETAQASAHMLRRLNWQMQQSWLLWGSVNYQRTRPSCSLRSMQWYR